MDWQGRRDSRTHQRAAQGQARGLAETGRGTWSHTVQGTIAYPTWRKRFFFWKVLLGRDMWIVPRRVFIPLLVEMNQIQFLLNPKELQSDLATARSEDSRDCPGDRSPGNFGQKARDEVRHFGQNMMEKWAALLAATCRLVKYDGSTNRNSQIS